VHSWLIDRVGRRLEKLVNRKNEVEEKRKGTATGGGKEKKAATDTNSNSVATDITAAVCEMRLVLAELRVEREELERSRQQQQRHYQEEHLREEQRGESFRATVASRRI
jgi:hypothetical protein